MNETRVAYTPVPPHSVEASLLSALMGEEPLGTLTYIVDYLPVDETKEGCSHALRMLGNAGNTISLSELIRFATLDGYLPMRIGIFHGWTLEPSILEQLYKADGSGLKQILALFPRIDYESFFNVGLVMENFRRKLVKAAPWQPIDGIQH